MKRAANDSDAAPKRWERILEYLEASFGRRMDSLLNDSPPEMSRLVGALLRLYQKSLLLAEAELKMNEPKSLVPLTSKYNTRSIACSRKCD